MLSIFGFNNSNNQVHVLLYTSTEKRRYSTMLPGNDFGQVNVDRNYFYRQQQHHHSMNLSQRWWTLVPIFFGILFIFVNCLVSDNLFSFWVRIVPQSFCHGLFSLCAFSKQFALLSSISHLLLPIYIEEKITQQFSSFI